MNPNRNNCFKCGKSGHWANFCPETKCYQCGKYGHIGRDCDIKPFHHRNKKRKLNVNKNQFVATNKIKASPAFCTENIPHTINDECEAYNDESNHSSIIIVFLKIIVKILLKIYDRLKISQTDETGVQTLTKYDIEENGVKGYPIFPYPKRSMIKLQSP